MNRRCFVIRSVSTVGLSFLVQQGLIADEPRRLQITGLTTEYRHNSHSDVLLSRMFLNDTLDGKGQLPSLHLASVFTDQVPANDTSRAHAAKYGFKISSDVRDALTLGQGKLSVDGVMLVAEHGKYPQSDVGATIFPKRRLFEAVAAEFQASGRSVPVFIDKHLADNWTDAKWIYDTARELKVPLMAGSSLPGTWRYPPHDVRRDAKLKQIVAFSYHTLDAYGFHGLEVIQALAERRAGGETGVKQVRHLSGAAVWELVDRGPCDKALFEAAQRALVDKRWMKTKKSLRESVTEPSVIIIDYEDGLQGFLFTLNGAVTEWTAAWSYADSSPVEAATFDTQEWRPFYHFWLQLQGIERMMQTGRPSWPVERTLLTSGILHAAMSSAKHGNEVVVTPYMKIAYQSDWNWKQPPERPRNRWLTDQ